jgi:hypothetical protein
MKLSTVMTELTGDQVMADRKRRKMSRTAYAEMLGEPFTPTKIRNIELTRDARPEELEILLRHVEVDHDVTPASPAPDGAQAEPRRPAPVIVLTDEEIEESEDELRVLPPLATNHDQVGDYVNDHGPGTVVTCKACNGGKVILHEVEPGHWTRETCSMCDGQGVMHLPDPDVPVPPSDPPMDPGASPPSQDAYCIVVDDGTRCAHLACLATADQQWHEAQAEGDVEPADIPRMLPTQVDFELPGYHVTNSELRTFKRCRRKWYLAYYRGLKLKHEDMTGPRAIGLRVHLALAAYYGMQEDPLAVLHATVQDDLSRVSQDQLEKFQSEAELARIMLEGYLDWLQETGRDQGLKVIAPEQIVEVPFSSDLPGVILVGKMDLRVERQLDNARLFLDHKTVGSLTAPLQGLAQDEQMLHYHLLEFLNLLREDGKDAAGSAPGQHAMGGLYNMLRRVKRTERAKPPFYERVEVQHNIHELRNYYLRVFGEITDILHVRGELNRGVNHRQIAYANPTKDCSWDCDFVAICPLFDDGSAAEEMAAEYYRVTHPQEHYWPYGEGEHRRVSDVSSSSLHDNDG